MVTCSDQSTKGYSQLCAPAVKPISFFMATSVLTNVANNDAYSFLELKSIPDIIVCLILTAAALVLTFIHFTTAVTGRGTEPETILPIAIAIGSTS